MAELIILGSGAATGVPSLSGGWGDCNPENPKNRRQRAGVYFEDGSTKLLIDTSPDVKNQLIDNGIKELDAVLYTHTHADHLHGIDDLRGITRNLKHSLKIYATEPQLKEIEERFAYSFSNLRHDDITNHPELLPEKISYLHSFAVKNTEIMPLEFHGHTMITTGFCFNNGQAVLVPDFRIIPPDTLEYLKNIDVNVLIIPLTILHEGVYHAGIETVLKYAGEIGAKKVILTHMAIECDYENVDKITPEFMHPAYDNMRIEL